jgi:hypothetical protein
MRRPVRPRRALPSLGFLLSDDRSPQRHLLAQVEGDAARYGGDYRQVETATDATGKSCQAACEADARCRAWTYVRPGYVGPSAVCYLKNRITRPIRKPCCISGVVR